MPSRKLRVDVVVALVTYVLSVEADLTHLFVICRGRPHPPLSVEGDLAQIFQKDYLRLFLPGPLPILTHP